MRAIDPKELCFICGRPGCDDRDHVVPCCFFPESKPDDLLTLPAHHDCHAKLDEEYARAIITGVHAYSSPVARELFEGKITRSMKRSEPLRAAILATLRPEVDVKSHDGVIVGSSPALQFDRDRVYPVLEKIVKALWRHHRAYTMPANIEMGWHIFHVPPTGGVLEVLKQSKVGIAFPPVFRSKYFVFPRQSGEEQVSVWWLRFYEDLSMYCVVVDRSEPRRLTSACSRRAWLSRWLPSAAAQRPHPSRQP